MFFEISQEELERFVGIQDEDSLEGLGSESADLSNSNDSKIRI